MPGSGTVMGVNVRPLTVAEFRSPELRHLLWLAAEPDADESARILEQDLPRLRVLGVERRSDLVAFVAYDVTPSAVTIEYIAVSEREQGHGLATGLIGAIRAREPGRVLVAETDDDAVGFYRRLGFLVEPAAPDARWPGRARYRCVVREGPGGFSAAVAP